MILNLSVVEVLPLVGLPDAVLGMQVVPLAVLSMPPLVLDLPGIIAGGQ